jgi:hypothetical protein
MNLYCKECFAKIEYKFSKPKFCPECGLAIGSGVLNKPVVKKTETAVSDSDNLKRIKDLENQVQALKKINKVVESEEDEIDDNEYAPEDDYVQIQQHINSFKSLKNKPGIVIEKDNSQRGITFGQLIESSSSSTANSSNDFKFSEDGSKPTKSKEQILEEFRLEASSSPRLIEID